MIELHEFSLLKDDTECEVNPSGVDDIGLIVWSLDDGVDELHELGKVGFMAGERI
jgi:hypothetical protein